MPRRRGSSLRWPRVRTSSPQQGGNMTTMTTGPQRPDDKARRIALDNAVMKASRSGWRTVSRTVTQAQLVNGKSVNHILHLLLTLLTLGLWVFVWIGLAIFGGERQRLLTVDEFGIVHG